MNPQTFHPSPVKEGRRILGEKTANACFSPHRHGSISPTKRPLEQQHQLSPSPKKLLPSISFAGQKRSIDQVEYRDGSLSAKGGVRRAETTTRPETRDGQHVSEGRKDDLEDSDARSELQVPGLDQQQQNQEQEQEQEQEQPSTQSTQDTEPDEISHPASQTTQPQTRPVPEDPTTRKVFIQEKATLLRTRIQSAMRHRIRDPQFDRRVSELEAHSRKYPRLQFPEATTPRARRDRFDDEDEDEDEDVTPQLAQSTPSITPRAPNPAQNPNTNTPAGLSSPPLSAGNAHDSLKTPTQKSHNERADADPTGSPMQLSSPPASVLRKGLARTPGQQDEECDEDDRTQKQFVTPSQRGDAVDGLLKLMSTAEKGDGSSPWMGPRTIDE